MCWSGEALGVLAAVGLVLRRMLRLNKANSKSYGFR